MTTRVRYDWTRGGEPRIALFNRAMSWILPCLAVAMWVLSIRIAMHDWTVFFAPLPLTAAVVVQRISLRKVYRAEPQHPDYAAIARMEREVYGEASPAAYWMTADDYAAVRMLAGSSFGLGVKVTLPSGKTVSGGQIEDWNNRIQGG